MKISQFQIVIFTIFIIYPFAALPLIFVEIYNKNYYSLNYLAVFMGLISYLWIPSGDLYRMYLDFTALQFLSVSDFLNIKSFDYLYLIVMYIYAKLNFNFEFVRFTLCVISYLLYFKIYLEIIKYNKDIRESKVFSFLTFLILFFFIRFTGFITGVRFTFAMSMCFYGVYLVIYKNRSKGWFLLLLASLTHFSMWLLFLFVFVIKAFKLRLNRLLFVLILLSGILLSTKLIEVVIDYLPIDDGFKTHLAFYTSGTFASEEFANQTLFFKISRFLSYFAIYPAIIFVLFKKREFSFYSVFLFIVLFLSFSMNMDTTYGRYAFLGVIFFIIPFLLKFKKELDKRAFCLFFFLSFITYTASVYTVHKEIKYGNEYKILYTPLPLIFMSTYDAQWINYNIDDSGSMKN